MRIVITFEKKNFIYNFLILPHSENLSEIFVCRCAQCVCWTRWALCESKWCECEIIMVLRREDKKKNNHQRNNK